MYTPQMMVTTILARGCVTRNRPPPSFTDLPDLVHSHVSSFLIINDVLRVSETCRALLNSYGCKLQHLTVAWRLRKARARAHPGHPTPSELQVPRDPSHLFSLLRRHPNLRRLDIRYEPKHRD